MGSGTTTLTTLNEEMDDVIQIVKFLEDSGLLPKSVAKRIVNKKRTKGQIS